MIENLNIIKALKPENKEWLPLSPPSLAIEPIDVSAWFHKDGFYCISAVESVIPEGETSARPEYHLSFTRQSLRGILRVDSNDAQWILSQFGLEGWFEDNHVPFGKARNFWRPVNENLVGQICACVDDEPAIKENKGDYVWRPA